MTPADLEAYAPDFGPFDGRIWMNAAHQGPLPRSAAEAAARAVAAKVSPCRITDSDFMDVPSRLRGAIARVIGAHPDDVILANSASYGLSLLAAGTAWRTGDEILLVNGEFPASVFPWRVLEQRGVTLRFMDARCGHAPSADEVAHQLRPNTRVFCASWVNSFSGHALDIATVGSVCRGAGATFVLNASQGLGARMLDLATAPVDAVVCCGYKWLLGPYGTGFCWIEPRLRETMTAPKAYWLPNVWGKVQQLASYAVNPDLGARAWDIFDTANFFNFVPWIVSLEYMVAKSLDRIAVHDNALVARLVEGLPRDLCELVSPLEGPRRSTLVVVTPRSGRDAKQVLAALAAGGIDAAARDGAIRLSPHLYNTAADVDRTIAALCHALAVRSS